MGGAGERDRGVGRHRPSIHSHAKRTRIPGGTCAGMPSRVVTRSVFVASGNLAAASTSALVSRSAVFGSRYVAKNIVAAGLADRCEIQFAYAIGVAKPVSISVDSFGSGKISDDKLAEIVEANFDLRPAAIIRDLDLRKPIYRKLAAYGHFGRSELDLPWERTDKAEALRAFAQK